MRSYFDKLSRIKKMLKIGCFGLILASLLLTGGLVRQVHAVIPASERAALTSLYNSTNGDKWDNNSGWKQPPLHGDGFALPGTECSWYGVECTGGFVTKVGLYSNQLSGSIPTELGNLTNLALLSLNSNQLSGSIPPQLGNLTNLTFLALGSNQLSGSIPPELGNLTNLMFFNLDSNQLSGSIPPQLGSLTNLTFLHLNSNQLSGSIPPELGNLTNLALLYLNSNQLSGSIPPELGNLTNLGILYLNSNQLAGNIPAEIMNLKSLWEIDICNNNLYTSNPNLRDFLNGLQPEWESCQSRPSLKVKAMPWIPLLLLYD